MKKGLFKCLTVLLFAAVLFTSCGDGTTVKTNYADYVIRVVDNDEVPVEGVTVIIAYQGAPTEEKAMPEVARSVVKVKDQVTKEDGLAKFENLTSGTYLITLIPPFDDKTGEVTHLFSCQYIGVNPVYASKDYDNVYQFRTVDFLLPKLGGTLSATVMLPSQSDAGLVEKPAGEGKEVALKVCATGYYFPQVTGTGEKKDPYVLSMGLPYAKAVTNAEGVVTFENLPLQTYTTGNNPMSISYWDMTKNQQRNDNIDYVGNGSGIGRGSLTLGGLYPLTFDAGKVYIGQLYADIMLVNTNLRDEYLNDGIFKLDSDIVLTFDTEITTVEKATLYNTVSKSYVDVVSSIGTDDAKIVTLNPSADLAYGTKYALSFIVKGAENKDLDRDIEFKTIPDPAQPAKPAFTINSYKVGESNITLDITAMNADCTYKLESKVASAAEWSTSTSKKLSDASANDGTNAIVTFNTDTSVPSNEAMSLRLVAIYNDKEVRSDVVDISATKFNLVYNNITTKDRAAELNFVVDANITLTFETDVTEVTSVTLWNKDMSEWADVVATINADNKKQVIVNPVNNLVADTSYTLTYKVKGGEKTSENSDGMVFKTAPLSGLPLKPAFTLSSNANHGLSSLSFDFTNLSNDCTYDVETKYSTDVEWNRIEEITLNTTDASAIYTGSAWRFNVLMADKVVSGKKLQVRFRASYKNTIVYSDVVEVLDTVAPTPNRVYRGNKDGPNNSIIYTYYFTSTTSTEPVSVAVVAKSITDVTVSVADTTNHKDGTKWEMTITVPQANIEEPGTITYSFKDAAGNTYDAGPTTDGIQNVTLDIGGW